MVSDDRGADPNTTFTRRVIKQAGTNTGANNNVQGKPQQNPQYRLRSGQAATTSRKQGSCSRSKHRNLTQRTRKHA